MAHPTTLGACGSINRRSWGDTLNRNHMRVPLLRLLSLTISLALAMAGSSWIDVSLVDSAVPAMAAVAARASTIAAHILISPELLPISLQRPSKVWASLWSTWILSQVGRYHITPLRGQQVTPVLDFCCCFTNKAYLDITSLLCRWLDKSFIFLANFLDKGFFFPTAPWFNIL